MLEGTLRCTTIVALVLGLQSAYLPEARAQVEENNSVQLNEGPKGGSPTARAGPPVRAKIQRLRTAGITLLAAGLALFGGIFVYQGLVDSDSDADTARNIAVLSTMGAVSGLCLITSTGLLLRARFLAQRQSAQASNAPSSFLFGFGLKLRVQL